MDWTRTTATKHSFQTQGLPISILEVSFLAVHDLSGFCVASHNALFQFNSRDPVFLYPFNCALRVIQPEVELKHLTTPKISECQIVNKMRDGHHVLFAGTKLIDSKKECMIYV